MINLMKSTFYKEEETRKALSAFVLDTHKLSMGEQCEIFESNFAKKQGRKYCVFVSSGSMANLVLIQALLNIGYLHRGNKVAVSSLTWSTNIMPLVQLGLVPVALDCARETLSVSSSILQAVEREDIKTVFVTNVLGFSGDMDKIRHWCSRQGIVLLEDNCESLGSEVSGVKLGNFGFASTFSTFVGHHLSTIEGGMVCTDDETLYEALLMVRAHGWDRNLAPEKQAVIRKQNGVDDFFARYTFYDLAFNARPTEISGFLGNQQLKYWDEIVAIREKNFMKFHKAIESNDDLDTLDLHHMDVVSNFAMPVICKDEDGFRKYRRKFEEAEVEIRPIIAGNMAKQPFYKKHVRDGSFCPNADFIHRNGFYFPNNPELTEEETLLLSELLSK